MEEEAGVEEDWEKQRLFYDTVRESIICLLVFLSLYLGSYSLVTRFQRHFSREDCYTDSEDHLVYRITTWLCSFALSVSAASALLLPLSIISNEVIVLYPHSDYVQWLNPSLIKGLWNLVFLGCNLSLFLCLPFAYLFSESAGLACFSKGVMSRVYETLLVLSLLCALVFGLSWLLLDQDTSLGNSWFLYLPLLYSAMSLLGVVLMGVCTPLGVSHLFTVLGALITSPKPTTNVEEELEHIKSEERTLLEQLSGEGKGEGEGVRRRKREANGVEERKTLAEVQHRKAQLERHLNSSPLERHVLYPLAFLGLLALTLLALLLVALNSAALLLYSQSCIESSQVGYLLGKASTSHLGLLGSLVEIIVILYIQCASIVGLYSLPHFHRLLPSPHNTSLTTVIANCVLLLMLTSALPLTSKTLGITQFSLLGLYQTTQWLSNTGLLFWYNSLFLSLTTFIVSRRVSKAIIREASKLLASWFSWQRRKTKLPLATVHNHAD